MSKIELGIRLKELRGDASLKSVSDDTGIPLDYLERLEEGTKIDTPSAHAIWKLNEYYKSDLKELLILGGIIVPKPYAKCNSCGESFVREKTYGCCPSCEAMIGDPFY